MSLLRRLDYGPCQSPTMEESVERLPQGIEGGGHRYVCSHEMYVLSSLVGRSSAALVAVEYWKRWSDLKCFPVSLIFLGRTHL